MENTEGFLSAWKKHTPGRKRKRREKRNDEKADALLGMMCALVPAARAEESLSVRRADGVGGEVAMWEKSNGQKYLFLPAYMEGETLEIRYDGLDSVCLGEMDLPSGAQTDAVAEGTALNLVREGQTESLLVMQSANLPAVHLETESGSLSYIHEKKGNKEKGHVLIVTADGAVNYQGKADSIKGHGNATFVYDKKSYQVKLDKKAPLLGMDEGKSYVLLANQHENSLLRNRITLELAQAVGLPYTSECRSVDLYVNGEYRGSYLLCDKVTISSGSVDVIESKDEIELLNEALVKRNWIPETYGPNSYTKDSYKASPGPGNPAT